MARAVRVNGGDSVATLVEDAEAGERIDGFDVTTAGAIGRGHKVALVPLAACAPVIKYGFPIGVATRAIARGDHVHSDNLAAGLGGTLDYRYAPGTTMVAAPSTPATFHGYVRTDGRVGTRNEIWILPTVGCVARIAQRIAERSAACVEGKVDGAHAFTHPHGCSQLGDDLGGTRAILASLACHPNAGGVLGVKCGGSDGLSGLTANPLVGRLSDQVAGTGGRVIATEIPEMFGAERTLMTRAANEAVSTSLSMWSTASSATSSTMGRPCLRTPRPAMSRAGSPRWRRSRLVAGRRPGARQWPTSYPMARA